MLYAIIGCLACWGFVLIKEFLERREQRLEWERRHVGEVVQRAQTTLYVQANLLQAEIDRLSREDDQRQLAIATPVEDWERLPSNVCSDEEWTEIVSGPGSTWRLTQDYIDELDKIVDPIGTLKRRWEHFPADPARGFDNADDRQWMADAMNFLGAKEAGDKMVRDGYFKAGAILQVYREQEEQRRHAAEYAELQDWMKEGSVRSDESLPTYEQRKILGYSPRPRRG